MHEIRGNKWKKRLCKWIASLLTVALLINQSCFSVLAQETREDDVCCCDAYCNADSINEDCPVCAEDYEKCEGAENITDIIIDDEANASDASEDVDTDTNTESDDEEYADTGGELPPPE